MKHIVDLSWDNGKVVATEKKSGDITTYHLKKDDKPDGSVVIWEYPVNDPPFGLYIGGCLTPGEKVITQRGLVNVEDVTLDDKLLNKDNKFVEIKNLQRYEKVNESIYKLKPTGSFRTTTFTGEHPIWIHNKGFVKMKDVSCDDWLEIPNRYRPYDCMRKFENGLEDTLNKFLIAGGLEFFYFLGLWLGDGFVNINGNSHDIYLTIGKEENELAEFYDNLIKTTFNRECVHVHKQKENTRRFTHKELALFLNKEFGKTAYSKRIPDWVKEATPGLKLAFLQGYLDSDGSVFYDNGKVRVNFTSVNLELLEDIQDILYGLEISNSIVIHQKRNKNAFGGVSLESYRINITRCDNLKLAQNPVFESRKIKVLWLSKSTGKSRQNVKFEGNKILLKVEKIDESSYTGVVYNFECETHTFMCRNILTHNCDPLTHQRGITEQKRWKSLINRENTVLSLLIAKGSKPV